MFGLKKMTFVNFSNMQAGTLSPTKGNIGHGQRRRRQRMFLWGVGLCCLLCAAAFRIYDKFSLYGLGLEEEMDDDGIISSRKSHRKKLRKEGKNERHKKR